jgi:hypothetical protein
MSRTAYRNGSFRRLTLLYALLNDVRTNDDSAFALSITTSPFNWILFLPCHCSRYRAILTEILFALFAIRTFSCDLTDGEVYPILTVMLRVLCLPLQTACCAAR